MRVRLSAASEASRVLVLVGRSALVVGVTSSLFTFRSQAALLAWCEAADYDPADEHAPHVEAFRAGYDAGWRWLNSGSNPEIPATWVVLHRPTRNIVAEYDTEAEALEAASWYEDTFGGGKLEVQRA